MVDDTGLEKSLTYFTDFHKPLQPLKLLRFKPSNVT